MNIKTIIQKPGKSTSRLIALALSILAAQACAKATDQLAPVDPTEGGTTVGNGAVALSIIGSRPATSLTQARTQTSFFRMPGAFQVDEADPDSVDIDVKDVSGTSIGTLTLTDARLALKQIKLKLANDDGDEDDDLDDDSSRLSARSGDDDDDSEDDSDDDDRGFDGPYVVDLITNETTPSIDNLDLTAGTYRRIELKLHKITGEEHDDQGDEIIGVDDGLYDNSIVMAGTYSGTTASGEVTDVPFNLSFDLTEEFRLEGQGDSEGFTITEDEDNTVIIAFRLLQWFDFANEDTNSDGIDFSQIEVTQDAESNNQIVLDKDAEDPNSDIRQVIKENVKVSADFGKDKDGDGNLGSDEDDDEDEFDDSGEDGDDTDDNDEDDSDDDNP